MTNPTEPGAASVSAPEFITYNPVYDVTYVGSQPAQGYVYALTTPARSSGEMERMREAVYDARDRRKLVDLIDDPYIRERVERVCQQRDDAFNAATVLSVALRKIKQ